MSAPTRALTPVMATLTSATISARRGVITSTFALTATIASKNKCQNRRIRHKIRQLTKLSADWHNLRLQVREDDDNRLELSAGLDIDSVEGKGGARMDCGNTGASSDNVDWCGGCKEGARNGGDGGEDAKGTHYNKECGGRVGLKRRKRVGEGS